MRAIILGTLAFWFLSAPLMSQKHGFVSVKRNGIYAEGYALRHDFSDGFVSVNYERAAGRKGSTNFRIGVYPDFQSTVSFPLTVTWITSPHGHHHFEYGIGGILRVEHYVDRFDPAQTQEWFYDMPAIMVPLMYRYQKKSGWYLRAGVNLFLSWPVLPSPSMSLGYRF